MNTLLLLLLAQTPTTANLPAHGVAFDVLRPDFRGSSGLSLMSFAMFFSGRIPMSKGALHFELPLAHADAENAGQSTTLGNPYIGFEFGGQTGLGGETGVRFPLTSEDEFAGIIGFNSDISRFEAFLANLAAFQGFVRYRVRTPDGFTFDAGGGPAIWFPTKGGGDAELVLHHHMTAGYLGQGMWLQVGFSGVTIVSEDAGGIGERTINQLAASVGGAIGNMRPAVHAIVPLDDEFNSDVGIVLGFGLAFTLR
jgi:hypothetical protein